MNIHIPASLRSVSFQRLHQLGLAGLTVAVIAALAATLLTDREIQTAAALLEAAEQNAPACGNGKLDAAESCDDGNAVIGDGCVLCRVEAGFACGGEPSSCAVVQSTEPEGAASSSSEVASSSSASSISSSSSISSISSSSSSSSSPSSSSSSSPSSSSSAPSSPSSSSSAEAAQASQGGASSQSSFFRVRPRNAETGYGLPPPSSSSAARGISGPVHVCGDGYPTGSEECDDGNAGDGDGCSASCKVESGYACESQPSACRIRCGNGIVTSPPESCDDGNLLDGDGCSSACKQEFGYACTGAPSQCRLLTPPPGSQSSSSAASSSSSSNAST